jgi:hypothetical protein
MAQQCPLAGWANPWDFLQPGLANIFLAADSMRADGKAMGFIAQPLDKIKQGISRRQFERVTARHEEGLSPSIAVGSFGDGNERHIGDPERAQRLLRSR